MGPLALLVLGACSDDDATSAEIVAAPGFPVDRVMVSSDGDECLESTCRRAMFEGEPSSPLVFEAASRGDPEGLELLYFLPPGFEATDEVAELHASDGRVYEGAVGPTGASLLVVLPGPGVKVERIVTGRLDCSPLTSGSTMTFECEVQK